MVNIFLAILEKLFYILGIFITLDNTHIFTLAVYFSSDFLLITEFRILTYSICPCVLFMDSGFQILRMSPQTHKHFLKTILNFIFSSVVLSFVCMI